MLDFISYTIKNDDIPTVNVMQFIRHFVHENSVLGHQSRLHAWAINVVLLEQEQSNQHRRTNGDHNNEDPFPNSAHLRSLFFAQI